MTNEIATSDAPLPRLALVAAGLFGVVMAVAGLLWLHFGTEVFLQTIVAGLAGCF